MQNKPHGLNQIRYSSAPYEKVLQMNKQVLKAKMVR